MSVICDIFVALEWRMVVGHLIGYVRADIARLTYRRPKERSSDIANVIFRWKRWLVAMPKHISPAEWAGQGRPNERVQSACGHCQHSCASVDILTRLDSPSLPFESVKFLT